MTCEDFSNNFDILLASYKSQISSGDTTSYQDIVLDEYEKSLFLTRAQEVLVTTYYSGSSGVSFEMTEEIRRYLDSLVKSANCIQFTQKDSNSITTYVNVLDVNSDREEFIYDDFTYGSFKQSIFKLPKDLWYIIYEQIKYDSTLNCYKNKSAKVVPVTHNELDQVIENPFRGPTLKRVLRLDVGPKFVELISKEPIQEYKIKYVSKPTPIILQDFDEENKIEGINTKTECALHSSLHRVILEMAVQLAIASITKDGKTE